MNNTEVKIYPTSPDPIEALELPGFSYQVSCYMMDLDVKAATMTVQEMALVLGKDLEIEDLTLVDQMMYFLHLNYTYREPLKDKAGNRLYPVTMFPALQCSLRSYGLYYGI